MICLRRNQCIQQGCSITHELVVSDQGRADWLVHAQVKCFAGEEAPKYAPDFAAASCKGFWSGIFGHRVSS